MSDNANLLDIEKIRKAGRLFIYLVAISAVTVYAQSHDSRRTHR